jgi:hypothetical protein
MNLQAKNITEFRQAGEILYVLHASNSFGVKDISKVSLQKLIYLSVVLSPIKDIIINFLRFQYNYRGPFNYEIQNTVDHLVGLDYVRITEYNFVNEKKVLISYAITEKGTDSVKNLVKFDRESEKYWWIKCICRLAINYSEEKYDSNWKGLDRIVDLVYQDPTFSKGKTDGSFRRGIDLGGQMDFTKDLITFIKEYISNSTIKFESKDERRNAEIILVLFFEYLFSKVTKKEV